MVSDQHPPLPNTNDIANNSGNSSGNVPVNVTNGSGQYSICAVAWIFIAPALGAFLFGYDIGSTSYILLQLTSASSTTTTTMMTTTSNNHIVDHPFPPLLQGLFVSAPTTGAWIGSIIVFGIADRIGRKCELQWGALLCGIGSICQVLSGYWMMMTMMSDQSTTGQTNIADTTISPDWDIFGATTTSSVLMSPRILFPSPSRQSSSSFLLVLLPVVGIGLLLVGRFIFGIGIGFALHGGPTYISEMSPTPIRGLLISLLEGIIVLGLVMGYILGDFLSSSSSSSSLGSKKSTTTTTMLLHTTTHTMKDDSSSKNDTWIYLVFVSVVASLLMYWVSKVIIPPSPRWLLLFAQNDEEEEDDDDDHHQHPIAITTAAYESLIFIYPHDDTQVQHELECIQQQLRQNNHSQFHQHSSSSQQRRRQEEEEPLDEDHERILQNEDEDDDNEEEFHHPPLEFSSWDTTTTTTGISFPWNIARLYYNKVRVLFVRTNNDDNNNEAATSYYRYGPSLRAGIGLAILQQFTGQPSLLSYVAPILESVGLSSRFSIVIGMVKVVCTILTATTVEHWGRQRLLYGGCSLMVLGLVILMITCSSSSSSSPTWNNNGDEYYQVNAKEDTSRGDFSYSSLVSSSYIILVALLVYIVGYQMGLGPMTMVVNSEIYPTEIRALGLALSAQASFLSHAMVQVGFALVVSPSSSGGTGERGLGMASGIFAVLVIYTMFFVYWYIPETRGLSLEEIEALQTCHSNNTPHNTPISPIMDDWQSAGGADHQGTMQQQQQRRHLDGEGEGLLGEERQTELQFLEIVEG